MLPLKTILIHRLESVAREIDDQISDYLAGATVSADEEPAPPPMDGPKPKNTTILYYTEHKTPLYLLCNQWLVNLAKGLKTSVAQDRLLLNGKNTPLPPLPPPKCIAYTSGEFPPPDAPWWKEAQQLVQPQVTVLRDGEFSKIPAEDIVTGDILYINGGDKIHADIRVIVADQCVAESYLGLESRQYNLLEYCDNSDPLLASNLVPFTSVLLEGTMFGMVVRVGKRTLYSGIGSRILSEMNLPQDTGNMSISKAKSSYQRLCENKIILRNLETLPNILKAVNIVAIIHEQNLEDINQCIEICRQNNLKLLLINHDTFLDKYRNVISFPFRDDVPFNELAVRMFTDSYYKNNRICEGVLLSPDLVYIIIDELEKLSGERNIAFIGGTYVEHLQAMKIASSSYCYLDGVELGRDRADGIFLTNKISSFFTAREIVKDINTQTCNVM